MTQQGIKPGRRSNLELLRIVCMLLVILIHYLPMRVPVTDASLLSEHPLQALTNLELHSIAVICTHCFVLISGYFGIRWKLRSFGGLLFQLLFWAVAGYAVVQYLIAPMYPAAAVDGLPAYLRATMDWYRARWFVSAYICLYICSPLLNSFIQAASERQLRDYLLVFYGFSTVFGYMMLSAEFEAGTSAISLMGLYLLGAWLRRSQARVVNWSKWYDLTAFAGCTLLLTAVSAALLRMGVTKSIYGYLNPVVIVESVFLFQFFRKWDLGYIGWINYPAAGAFAAYLFHYHPCVFGHVQALWSLIDKAYGGSWAAVAASICGIFVFAALVDRLRIALWRGIVRIVRWRVTITPPAQVFDLQHVVSCINMMRWMHGRMTFRCT